MMVKLCATRQTRHLPAVRGLAVAATPFPFLECCRAYSAGPSLIEGVKCFFRFGRGVFFLPSQKSRAQEPRTAPLDRDYFGGAWAASQAAFRGADLRYYDPQHVSPKAIPR